MSGLSDVVAISAGKLHTVAIKNDGTVWAWGYNLDGQLGNGTTTGSLTPVQVSGFPADAIVMAKAGAGHTVVLKTDGTVWTWGWNSLGELGDGTNTNSATP